MGAALDCSPVQSKAKRFAARQTEGQLPPMNKTALIFDVDGTLAETEESHRRAFNETFGEAGLDWHWNVERYGELLLTMGGKERMRAHREEIGADEPDDQTIRELHARKTVRYGEIVAAGGLVLRTGIAELIKAARSNGVPLAVATTTTRENVDILCQVCLGEGADDVFDAIAAGDEVANKKPAPDIYRLALERLDMPPDQAIAFEDTRNGVLSAKAAGLKVIASPSSYSRGEDLSDADWLVQDWSIDELPPVLRALTG